MIPQSRMPHAGRETHPSAPSCSLHEWPGIVIEVGTAVDSRDAFLRLCHLPHCVFFDSALRDAELGRYSFIAADPFQVISFDAENATLWPNITSLLNRFTAPTITELPPFQGGLAGLFSYDLARSLERLPLPQFDEFQLPGAVLGAYDVVIALDHQTDQAWIISQGFPEMDSVRRHRRAKSRAAEFERLLNSNPTGRKANIASPIPVSQLAPQYSAGHLKELTSNFSREQYLAMVRRGIDYIYAGDVFQVNLAQRLLYPAHDDAVALYLRLRERNPAPFAAYFDLGGSQIVSTSPERFLQVRDRQVEARPIKGTRARSSRPNDDRGSGLELLASEKDRAENVMIVDLLRNDLSRVCAPHSVAVDELCRLERYEFVQHLVSVISGELRDECSPINLLRAAFPGGSVTGAPENSRHGNHRGTRADCSRTVLWFAGLYRI